MRCLLATLLLFTFSLSNAWAQLGSGQSSPTLNWSMKENDHVKLIYSDELKNESDYIMNLVEHYSHVVGETYSIKSPLQFPLIMRPEVADPNGFVTLGPRRSEWFTSAIYSPFVGGTEWYQTLAIHEYRHVIQYDHFNRGTTKALDYVLGDTGRALAAFLGLQSWYFEGDAVWAETKYTDAGRGRSPRFMARLKALVLSDKIPSYDEFLNGSYNNRYPNQYVWGYVLISSATQKFGDDFWKKVTHKVATFPHPWRLVESFYDVSGQNFREFYDQTMNELKESWKADFTGHAISEYREETYPFMLDNKLHFLKYDLDNYYAITQREGESDKKIADIPFINDVTQVSMAGTHAVYPQFLPDTRYAYKGFSDLILVDLKTGKKTQITHEGRFYNPHLNQTGSKLLAIEFTKDQAWQITELQIDGKRVRSAKLPDHKVIEAHYLTDNEAVALVLDKTGKKSLMKIDLKSNSATTLIAPSKNLLFALNVDQAQNIFFEAQYRGKNEIFKLNRDLQKCTNSKIAAFAPSSDGQNLYYSDMDVSGTKLNSVPLTQCQTVTMNDLTQNYLSLDSPSDNYNRFPLKDFADQEKMFNPSEKNSKEDDYGHFDKRLFIPHSWSFLGGRGLQLNATTANYLGTMGMDVTLGRDAEETGQFYTFGFDYNKYYPLFRLSGGPTDRYTKDYRTEDTLSWSEYEAGLSMTLPYFKKFDLYNIATALTLGASYLETDEYQFNSDDVAGRSQYFHNTSVNFNFTLSKDQVYRSIVSPQEFQYVIHADQAKNDSNKTISSYRVFQAVNLQLPGLFKHNALKLNFTEEYQRDTAGAYRFQPYASNPLGYVYSRGYAYMFAPHYRRASANYVFPLAYPDFALGSLWFLKRLYANAFFDSTAVDNQSSNPTLNSTGLELNFESRIARILPITIGVRGVNRLQDGLTAAEVFFGLGATL